MAKLNPSDPQFGIPVATRIDPKLAHSLNDEAGKRGISLSKQVAITLSRTSALDERIKQLEAELSACKLSLEKKDTEQNDLKEFYKNSAGKLIMKISAGDKERTQELIQFYNKIIQDGRNS